MGPPAEGYEPAPSMGRPSDRRNPVKQFGLWHVLSSTRCVPAFMVRQEPEELAERFRIILEDSWDGLDEVKVAWFEAGGESYAIVRHRGARPGTVVWMIHGELSEQAEEKFLTLFGLTSEDVIWRADSETFER